MAKKNCAQVLADEVRSCSNVENADRRASGIWPAKPVRIQTHAPSQFSGRFVYC